MKATANPLILLRHLAVAMLMGVYVFALFFNALHEVVHRDHHHQQETCTSESEKDPCHKRIFHHDLAEGCKHNTHMFPQENVCKLCDAILAKYYYYSEKPAIRPATKIFHTSATFEKLFVHRYSNASTRLRAPPCCSPLHV